MEEKKGRKKLPEVQLLRSIYQKNAKPMAIVLVYELEIDPVILKLSRFFQVQSERKRTLVSVTC